MTEAQQLQDRVSTQLSSLRVEVDKLFLRRLVIFRRGQYKGRLGLVKSAMLDDRMGIRLLAQPLKLRVVAVDKPVDRIMERDLLSTRVDARTFWPLDCVELQPVRPRVGAVEDLPMDGL